MKRTILTFILCLMTFFGLSGCRNKSSLKYDEETKNFNATILECNQSSMIVIPDKDEEEYKSSDKFRIAFAGDYQTCNKNDRVNITYVGGINESYPAQIETIKIELTSK